MFYPHATTKGWSQVFVANEGQFYFEGFRKNRNSTDLLLSVYVLFFSDVGNTIPSENSMPTLDRRGDGWGVKGQVAE